MTSQPTPIETNNPHVAEARAALEGSTSAATDETAAHLVGRAVALAGLAQAYESRTIALQRYHAYLVSDTGRGHSPRTEAKAVLAEIRERLGRKAS